MCDCPRCGKATIVFDSRHQQTDNTIYRRRRCYKCEYRFSTYEFRVGDLAALRLFLARSQKEIDSINARSLEVVK